MRIFGIILVILGGLALGYQGLTYVKGERADAGLVPVTAEREKTVWVPPVVGGIVLVTGLIVIATTGKRETA